MNIPEFATIRLSDAERFKRGFKQLLEETNVYNIDYSLISLKTTFTGADGSYINMCALLDYCDFNATAEVENYLKTH